MLPFPLPNKEEGDGLGAAHVNALSAVANNAAAMHTSSFGVGRQGGSQSPLPPFVQRRVVVTAENFEDDENYLTIKMLYFDRTEANADDRWKPDEEGGEYELDPLGNTYSEGTKLSAYWDDQRGAFLPLASVGGGGSIMHFTIDDVDCDTGEWIVTPTHYTGECEEPPGADPYTGEYCVTPFCGSPFTDEELVASGKGVAAYTYNLETCRLHWLEVSHCAEQGC